MPMAEPGIGGGTRLAGVMGWPVAHSRSPQMHNAAYAALGIDWAYLPLEVEPARLADALSGLAALGFAGVNVTIPHKHPVAGLCDALSDEARRAGSVNTVLVRDGGRLFGETTDGAGMLDAIGDVPRGRAAVLGAGGAARAAVAALMARGLDVVYVLDGDRRPSTWPRRWGPRDAVAVGRGRAAACERHAGRPVRSGGGSAAEGRARGCDRGRV